MFKQHWDEVNADKVFNCSSLFIFVVHFNCSDQKGLEFHTNDPHFHVQSDGKVLVGRYVSSTNQISFMITALSETKDTWKTAVSILINGEKVFIYF